MRSKSLLALTISLSLALPFAAQAAERARRAPPKLDPRSDLTEHVGTDREGNPRAGRLYVTTGGMTRGGPELSPTTQGAILGGKIDGMRAGATRFMHPVMNGTHDKTREIVVARGQMKTRRFGGYVAVLALGDPLHPASQARLQAAEERGGPGVDEDTLDDMLNDHGHEESKVPWGKRAHILVVPTTVKEHVTTRLGRPFRKDELKLTLELHEIAEALGTQLGLANLDVFQNDAFGASVGQEHIHIVGTRARATTPDLEAPSGGRGPLRTIDGRGRVVPMGDDGLPASGSR